MIHIINNDNYMCTVNTALTLYTNKIKQSRDFEFKIKNNNNLK